VGEGEGRGQSYVDESLEGAVEKKTRSGGMITSTYIHVSSVDETQSALQ
jgi:hypothetical protein